MSFFTTSDEQWKRGQPPHAISCYARFLSKLHVNSYLVRQAVVTKPIFKVHYGTVRNDAGYYDLPALVLADAPFPHC